MKRTGLNDNTIDLRLNKSKKETNRKGTKVEKEAVQPHTVQPQTVQPQTEQPKTAQSKIEQPKALGLEVASKKTVQLTQSRYLKRYKNVVDQKKYKDIVNQRKEEHTADFARRFSKLLLEEQQCLEKFLNTRPEDFNQLKLLLASKQSIELEEKLVEEYYSQQSSEIPEQEINRLIEQQKNKINDKIEALKKESSAHAEKNQERNKRIFNKKIRIFNTNILPKALKKYFSQRKFKLESLKNNGLMMQEFMSELRDIISALEKQSLDTPLEHWDKKDIPHLYQIKNEASQVIEELIQIVAEQKQIINRIKDFPECEESYLVECGNHIARLEKNIAEFNHFSKIISNILAVYENSSRQLRVSEETKNSAEAVQAKVRQSVVEQTKPEPAEVQQNRLNPKLEGEKKSLVENSNIFDQKTFFEDAELRIEIDVRGTKIKREIDEVLAEKGHPTRLELHIVYYDKKTNKKIKVEDRSLSICQVEHLTSAIEDVDHIKNRTVTLFLPIKTADNKISKLTFTMRQDGYLELETLRDKRVELAIRSPKINVSIKHRNIIECALLELKANKIEHHGLILSENCKFSAIEFQNYGTILCSKYLKVFAKTLVNHAKAMMISHAIFYFDGNTLSNAGLISAAYGRICTYDRLYTAKDSVIFGDKNLKVISLGNEFECHGTISGLKQTLFVKNKLQIEKTGLIKGKDELVLISKEYQNQGGILGGMCYIYVEHFKNLANAYLHNINLTLFASESISNQGEIIGNIISLFALSPMDFDLTSVIIAKRLYLLSNGLIRNNGVLAVQYWGAIRSLTAIENDYSGQILGNGIVTINGGALFKNIGKAGGQRLLNVDTLKIINENSISCHETCFTPDELENNGLLETIGQGYYNALLQIINGPHAKTQSFDDLIIATPFLHNQSRMKDAFQLFLNNVKLNDESRKIAEECLNVLDGRTISDENLNKKQIIIHVLDWLKEIPVSLLTNPNPSIGQKFIKLIHDLILGVKPQEIDEDLLRAKREEDIVQRQQGLIFSDKNLLLDEVNVVENEGDLISNANLQGNVKELKNHILARIQALDNLDFKNRLAKLFNSGILKSKNLKLKVYTALENLASGIICVDEFMDIQGEEDVVGKNYGLMFAKNMLFNFKNGFHNFGMLSSANALTINASKCLKNLKEGKIHCEGALKLLSELEIFSEGDIFAYKTLSLMSALVKIQGNLSSNNELVIKTVDLILKGNIKSAHSLLMHITNHFDFQSGCFASNFTTLLLDKGYVFEKQIEHPGALTIKTLPHATILNKTKVSTQQGNLTVETGNIVNGQGNDFGRFHAYNGQFNAMSSTLDNAYGGIFGQNGVILNHSDLIKNGTLIRTERNGVIWYSQNGSYIVSDIGNILFICNQGGFKNEADVYSGCDLEFQIAKKLENIAGRILAERDAKLSAAIIENLRKYYIYNNNDSGRVQSGSAEILAGRDCDFGSSNVISTASDTYAGRNMFIDGNHNRETLYDYDTQTSGYWARRSHHRATRLTHGRDRYWVTVRNRVNHAAYPDHFAARTSIQGKNPRARYDFNSSVQTNNFNLKFDICNVGGQPVITSNILWIDDLRKFFKETPLFKVGGDANSLAVISPEVPVKMPRGNISPHVVIDAPVNLKVYYDPRIEIICLYEILMQRLGRAYLDNSDGTVAGAYRKLRENAFKYADGQSLNQEKLEKSTDPMIVYRAEDYNGQQVLFPYVVIPSRLGVHYGISVKDANIEGNNFNLTSTFEAQYTFKFKLDRLVIEQQTLTQQVLAFSKKLVQPAQRSTPIENTGVLKANHIIGSTKTYKQTGGLVKSGTGGTEITIEKEAIINGLRTQEILQGDRNATIMPRFSPAYMISDGTQRIHVTDGGFGVSGLFSYAEEDNILNTKEGITIEPMIEAFTLPSEKHRRKTIESTSSSALHSEFGAGRDVKMKAEYNGISLTATALSSGKSAILKSDTVTIKNGETTESTSVKGSRQKGFKVEKYSQKINRKNPLLSTLMIGEDFIVKAYKKIGLFGVKGLIKNNLIMTAPEVQIAGANATTHIENQCKSYGVSFFGSKALEAIARGEGRQALKHIAQSNSFVSAATKLAQSKDAADLSVGIVQTFIEGWRTASMVAHACNSNDPVQGNLLGAFTDQMGLTTVSEVNGTNKRIFNPTINFEFGKTTQNIKEVNVIPTELRVGGKVLIQGDIIRLNDGTELTADSIRVAAKKLLEITAAQNTCEVNGKSSSKSVSVHVIKPSIEGVGVSGSQSSTKSVTHKLAKLNAAKTLELESEKQIQALGQRLEALDLAMKASEITIASPQDTQTSKSSHWSISVSTSSVSAAAGKSKEHSRKTVESTTQAKSLTVTANKLKQVDATLPSGENSKFIRYDGEGEMERTFEYRENVEKKRSVEANISVSLKPGDTFPATYSLTSKNYKKIDNGKAKKRNIGVAGFVLNPVGFKKDADALKQFWHKITTPKPRVDPLSLEQQQRLREQEEAINQAIAAKRKELHDQQEQEYRALKKKEAEERAKNEAFREYLEETIVSSVQEQFNNVGLKISAEEIRLYALDPIQEIFEGSETDMRRNLVGLVGGSQNDIYKPEVLKQALGIVCNAVRRQAYSMTESEPNTSYSFANEDSVFGQMLEQETTKLKSYNQILKGNCISIDIKDEVQRKTLKDIENDVSASETRAIQKFVKNSLGYGSEKLSSSGFFGPVYAGTLPSTKSDGLSLQSTQVTEERKRKRESDVVNVPLPGPLNIGNAKVPSGPLNSQVAPKNNQAVNVIDAPKNKGAIQSKPSDKPSRIPVYSPENASAQKPRYQKRPNHPLGQNANQGAQKPSKIPVLKGSVGQQENSKSSALTSKQIENRKNWPLLAAMYDAYNASHRQRNLTTASAVSDPKNKGNTLSNPTAKRSRIPVYKPGNDKNKINNAKKLLAVDGQTKKSQLSNTEMRNAKKSIIKNNHRSEFQRLMILTENHDESLFCRDASCVKNIDKMIFQPCVQKPIRTVANIYEKNALIERRMEERYGPSRLNPGIGQATSNIVNFTTSLIPQSTNEAMGYVFGGKVLKVVGKPTVQGVNWLYRQGKIYHYLKRFNDKANVGHIFSRMNGRIKDGHLPDTQVNRRLIIETILDKNNLAEVSEWGVKVYARQLRDGTEVWAYVQNDVIKSGGINKVPKYFPKLKE